MQKQQIWFSIRYVIMIVILWLCRSRILQIFIQSWPVYILFIFLYIFIAPVYFCDCNKLYTCNTRPTQLVCHLLGPSSSILESLIAKWLCFFCLHSGHIRCNLLSSSTCTWSQLWASVSIEPVFPWSLRLSHQFTRVLLFFNFPQQWLPLIESVPVSLYWSSRDNHYLPLIIYQYTPPAGFRFFLAQPNS